MCKPCAENFVLLTDIVGSDEKIKIYFFHRGPDTYNTLEIGDEIIVTVTEPSVSGLISGSKTEVDYVSLSYVK